MGQAFSLEAAVIPLQSLPLLQGWEETDPYPLVLAHISAWLGPADQSLEGPQGKSPSVSAVT